MKHKAATKTGLPDRAPATFRWLIAACALASVAAAAAVAVAQTAWIGRTFPGFLVLPNRVVASIARPGWSGARDGAPFQMVVTEVDGQPVATSADVYRLAEDGGSRRASYAVRDGARTNVLELQTQVFTRADYLALFAAYAATGALYLLLGLFAVAVLPPATGRPILVVGAVAGAYALSAAGIYDAHGTLRVHALAEAFFPAAIAQLALAYPGRFRPAPAPWIAVAWFLSLAIAVPYQLLLGEPGAYSILHAAAETYLGLAGLGLAIRLLCELAAEPHATNPLLRGAAAGAVLGLGAPAVVVALSGVTGGGLPVNVTVATAFLFPVCLGWGLLRAQRVAALATA